MKILVVLKNKAKLIFALFTRRLTIFDDIPVLAIHRRIHTKNMEAAVPFLVAGKGEGDKCKELQWQHLGLLLTMAYLNYPIQN